MGRTIARDLHARMIIGRSDTRRVADEIDKAHAPLITALSRSEQLLTRLHEKGITLPHDQRDEVVDCLTVVRLVLEGSI